MNQRSTGVHEPPPSEPPPGSGAPVVILGAGAVGSYVGGLLAEAGRSVVLIDGWPEHVQAIRANGLTVAGPEGALLARPQAWHLGEVHRLARIRPALALLTVKLYDTRWAARMLADWLAPAVPLVTLQNAMIEDVVAAEAGRERTLGAIGSGLHVALERPGVVRRACRRRVGDGPVFEVGELDGRSTPRVRRIAALLDRVDHARVTTALRVRRWSKLCANAMISGLAALTGLDTRTVYERDDTRRIAAVLGAEALAVGAALGFAPTSLYGVAAGVWMRAAAGQADAGQADALAAVLAALAVQAAGIEGGAVSGSAQDLAKGRPTEVAFFNGYIAREGERLGIAVPTHAAIAAMIRAAEAGERAPGRHAIGEITAAARGRGAP